MTDDYVKRRMDRALGQAIDMAEAAEQERSVSLPPSIVGQMAIQLFRARFGMAMTDHVAYPEDDGRETY